MDDLPVRDNPAEKARIRAAAEMYNGTYNTYDGPYEDDSPKGTRAAHVCGIETLFRRSDVFQIKSHGVHLSCLISCLCRVEEQVGERESMHKGREAADDSSCAMHYYHHCDERSACPSSTGDG